MPSTYQTQVTAIGGRAGLAASADRRLRIQLAKPGAPDLGGADDEEAVGTNPEQLFGAAYAACFLSAIRKVAEREGVTIAADANVTAKVALRPGGDPGADAMALDVSLMVDLPNVGCEIARRMALAADDMCPYSRAIRGNVDVRIVVI